MGPKANRALKQRFTRNTSSQILFDFALILVALLGIYVIEFPGEAHAIAATHGLSLVAGILFINTASGLYHPTHRVPINRSFARAALALVLSLLLAYIAFSLLPPEIGNRELTKWLAMICVAGVIAHRVYAAHVNKRNLAHSRILIFGAGTPAQLVARAISAADPYVEIVGYIRGPNETHSVIPADKMLRDVGSLKERALDLDVSEIVVALTERRGGSMPLRELLDCKIAGVQVSDLSTYFEKMLGQIRIDQLHAGWLIFGSGFANGAVRDVFKRLFDVLVSCVLLALAAPFMLLAATCIALESRGAVFYRQQRVGQAGKTFSVLKFRSMKVGAEKDGVPQWAAASDNRVTRVGSVIRRFRIDEFPQLFNVLSGDMSLVGPRPERPFFVEQLTLEIPFYAVRHSVKPGISGWAQVCYQYGATVEDALEKLQYDLYYVKNHSLLLDILILFETVGVVLSGKGAR